MDLKLHAEENAVLTVVAGQSVFEILRLFTIVFRACGGD